MLGLVGLVLSTAVLSACTEDNSTPQVPVEKAVGIAVETPRVTLIDAGENAQQVLSFSDVDAEKQHLSVTIATGFAQNLVRDDAVNPTPELLAADPTEFHAPVTVHTEAAENSETSTRSVLAVIDTPTSSDPTAVENLDTARGFAFGWFANDAGQISSINFSAPVAASDEARATTEQNLSTLASLPVIFPTEKIGTGASWTVESRVTGQSTMLQTITYTATKITGDEVELAVSVEQRPTLGALQLTAAEGENEVEGELKVLESTTTSEGKLTVNLKQPLPTTGALEMTTRVVYGQDNEQVRVVQDTTTALRFESSSPTQ